MNLLFAGATGLIGRHLISRVLTDNHRVTLLTRNIRQAGRMVPSGVDLREWDARSLGDWVSSVDTADAVVNLSGASIGSGRWTHARKSELLQSRVLSTATLVQAIASVDRRPEVFVNASAVGYYGDVPEGDVTEDRAAGSDTLADICVQWERAALEATQHGIRVAIPRSGVVLHRSGGALPRLLLPFRLFAGGYLGSGRQWFPWVHIDDEVEALYHAVKTPALSGPFNVCAPQAVRMKEFCDVLGSVLHRPSWAPVPGFALRILLGEMAGPLLLAGQKAVAAKLRAAGFAFKHPSLRESLENILSR